jgi:hypothetical protein
MLHVVPYERARAALSPRPAIGVGVTAFGVLLLAIRRPPP